MVPTIASFEEKGWYLSQEGIDLIASEHPEANSLDDFINCAKDMDLRLLTTKGFNKTSEKVSEIPSPLVLQVLEVRNAAMPSVNQVEKPRLLSVLFTDGSKKKLKAVEVHGKVEGLKLHTPPGTKFLVTKPIEIKDQILILGPGMLKELGGHVQELVQAWRAGKQFLKRFGGKSVAKDGEDGAEQGPPAFVPFKVKPNQVTDQSKASERPKKREDQKDSAASEKKAKKKRADKPENKKTIDKTVDRNPKSEDKRVVEPNLDSQQVPQNSIDTSSKQDTKRNAANKREKKVKTERKDDSEKVTEKMTGSTNKKLVERKERASKKKPSKPADTTPIAAEEQETPVSAVSTKKDRPSKRKERSGIKEPEPTPVEQANDVAVPSSDSYAAAEKKSNRKKKVPKNVDRKKPQSSSVDTIEQKSSSQHQLKKEIIEQQVSESRASDEQNDRFAKPQRKKKSSKKKKEPTSSLDATEDWTSNAAEGWSSSAAKGWTSSVTEGWPSNAAEGWPSNATEGCSANVTEQHQSKQGATEQQAPEPLDEASVKPAKPQRKEKSSKKKKEPTTSLNTVDDWSKDISEADIQTIKLQAIDNNSKSEKKVKKDRSKKKEDKTAIAEEHANGSSATADALSSNTKKSQTKKATFKRSSRVNTSDESLGATVQPVVSTAAEKKPPKQKREKKLRQSKPPAEEKLKTSASTTVSEPINDHQRIPKPEESTEGSTSIQASKKDGQQVAPATTVTTTTATTTPSTFPSSFNSTPTDTTAASEVPVPPTNDIQPADDTTRYSTTYYNTPSHHLQPQQAQDYYYHPQDLHHPPVQQQQAIYAPMVDYSMLVPIDPNTGMPAGMYSYPPPQQPQPQPYMQPMYYMSDQQPTYYANHQPHYTQLYDEAHYDHHYGSYGRGRGGVYNNTSTRGRGGQSRGGYKPQ